MHNEQFSRLLRLSQKTGDRLIVTDPEGRDTVVILPLDEYEALIESAFGPDEEVEFVDIPSIDGDEEAEDEADFDPEELERGALRGLWEEPGDTPIEIIERPDADVEPEPVRQNEPIEPAVDPAMSATQRPKPQQVSKPMKRRDPVDGEEQFYLEPI